MATLYLAVPCTTAKSVATKLSSTLVLLPGPELNSRSGKPHMQEFFLGLSVRHKAVSVPDPAKSVVGGPISGTI